jgi:hypothetical protein
MMCKCGAQQYSGFKMCATCLVTESDKLLNLYESADRDAMAAALKTDAESCDMDELECADAILRKAALNRGSP